MKIPNFGENVYKQVICGGKKVGKWLRLSCVINYDERGNEIHRKFSDGYEWWSEYDERGNEVHRKYSYGREEWHEIEYDENGIKRTVLSFYEK